jgi:hypothetical protein
MFNKYEVVREFVNEGYLIPLDIAVNLMVEGYDVNALHRSLEGFSVEDLIDMKELYNE